MDPISLGWFWRCYNGLHLSLILFKETEFLLISQITKQWMLQRVNKPTHHLNSKGIIIAQIFNPKTLKSPTSLHPHPTKRFIFSLFSFGFISISMATQEIFNPINKVESSFGIAGCEKGSLRHGLRCVHWQSWMRKDYLKPISYSSIFFPFVHELPFRLKTTSLAEYYCIFKLQLWKWSPSILIFFLYFEH